jgi:preprotein translocase subunit SecE
MNRGAGGGSGTTTKPPSPAPNRPSTRVTAQRAANAARTQAFFRGLVSEMRRVTWPSRQEWVAATILTITLVAALSFYMYVIDQLLTLIFGLVHR